MGWKKGEEENKDDYVFGLGLCTIQDRPTESQV